MKWTWIALALLIAAALAAANAYSEEKAPATDVHRPLVELFTSQG